MINTCIQLFDLTPTSNDWGVAADWLDDQGHPLAHIFRTRQYCLFDPGFGDYGSGHGTGAGDGEGYGDGESSGYGDGRGYGSGSGPAAGYAGGFGEGRSYVSGDGDGAGGGCGFGNGCGTGSGDGTGSGVNWLGVGMESVHVS